MGVFWCLFWGFFELPVVGENLRKKQSAVMLSHGKYASTSCLQNLVMTSEEC